MREIKGPEDVEAKSAWHYPVLDSGRVGHFIPLKGKFIPAEEVGQIIAQVIADVKSKPYPVELAWRALAGRLRGNT